MARLNGHGHERRLGALQRRFRRASPSATNTAVWKLLRDLRGGVGLIALGAMIGAAVFAVIDSMHPPGAQPSHGILSLRPVYYATCREAFQDGRANIRRGEPGYRRELDADDDGKACEPYVGRRG